MNLTETMFKQEEHDVECGDARPARKQYLGIANDETNEITESRDQDEDKFVDGMEQRDVMITANNETNEITESRDQDGDKLLDGMEQRDVMEQQPHQGPQPSIGASNGLGWKMTAPPMHQPLYGKILGKTNYPPSRGSAIRDHSYSVTAEVFRNAPGAAFRPNFEAHEAELAFPSADQVPASHLFHQVSTFSQPDGMQNFLDALSTSATAPNTNEWANLKSPESWEVFANDYADRNSVFVSCPQQNLTHAFEAGSKPVQAPPIAAKIAFDQRSTGERMLVQTIHGPALLLTEQSFYAPVSTLNMATASPKSPPVSRRRKFQRWSYEEDDLLKQAVEIEGQPPYNWIKIAKKYFSNSRTGVQCKSRWTKSLQPGLVRGRWKPQEDDIIVELRSHGMKWGEIAESLPGRIGEHIRERYVNTLDPTLTKMPWTREEDAMLLQKQRELGNKWTDISKFLPGRSENAVKNRWHNAKMTQRRRMRQQAAERKRQEQQKKARQHCDVGSKSEGKLPGRSTVVGI